MISGGSSASRPIRALALVEDYRRTARDVLDRQMAERTRAFFAALHAGTDLVDFARTPLLLTLLVYLWRIESDLPQNRFRVYEKFVEQLITTHPARRRAAAQVTAGAPSLPADTIRLLARQPGLIVEATARPAPRASA